MKSRSSSKTLPWVVLGVLAMAALAVVAPGNAEPPGAPDRSRPPAPGPARPLVLPPVQTLSLSNGLPVLLAESHEVPVAVVSLVVRGGAVADPQDRIGAAAFAANLLDEGAAGKNSLTLADEIEFLGAEITVNASWDAIVVRLRAPVARLEAALALLGDIALRPDFPAPEMERLRKEALTGLLQARDQPRAVGSWALQRAVFGDHRYGRPFAGDATSLSALTVADLRGFHQRHFRPENAALLVVGDVTAASLPLLEKTFGAWARSGEARGPEVAAPRQVRGRSIWLIDRPGAAQSVVRIGRVGPGSPATEQHAMEVMNTLLGGSFTSRLNDNLREQHGYAYGAGSSFNQRRVAGLFLAASDVQTQSTSEALGEFMKELRRIATPAETTEVERARNYLALSYAEEFETTDQIAAKLVDQWVFGLPADYFTSFVPKALAVGAKELRKAAATTIDTENLAIVVVGDRAKVEAKLRALGLGTVRIVTLDEVMGPAPKL